MCTADDTEISGESLIPITETLDVGSHAACKKCSESKVDVLLRKKDAYCRSCFIPYISHKLRSTLGKSKIMKPADHVLIAFSGGQSSSALLHMLWMGTQAEDHKKLLYRMSVIYIDEGVILNQNEEQRIERINNIKKIAEYSKFDLYVTTLSDVLHINNSILNNNTFSEKWDNELKKLFDDLKSLTAKEDLLLKLRQKLLANAAKLLGCNKIFSSEDKTSLAIKLLTSVALGRGEQLAIEVGYQDPRFVDVLILRPMRDVERKEISYYNRYCNVSYLSTASLTTALPKTCSIRKVTEEFVTGLHEEFSSTVSTIFRIGDKLNVSSASFVDQEELCVLCCGSSMKAGSAEPDPDHSYSAEEALSFSRTVSNSCNKTNSNSCDNCNCSKLRKTLSEQELQNMFCYSCFLIIKDLRTLSSLPPAIIEEAKRRRDLMSMKNEIADFLL